MDTIVHRNPEIFVSLGDAWRELASADPFATVFHLPDYLGIWWSEFGRDCALRVVEMRQGESLVGIAPLMDLADGSTRFVGDPDVTDYLGPVSLQADRDAVALATLAEASGTIEFHGLACDSGWPQAIVRAAKDAGRSWSESEQDVCPRVSLEGGYDAYLARLSGKLRHEIRRKDRRLRDAGSVTVRLSTAEDIDADLDLFFRMQEDAGDERKAEFFDHNARQAFFSALGASFLNHAHLRNAVLESDGKPVAMYFGFSRSGVWSIYNSAFDRSLRDLSPGMVLLAECLRLAAEEGCATFDFLRGSESYKYRFGAVDVPVVQVLIEPS